jgi:hypothetical protein
MEVSGHLHARDDLPRSKSHGTHCIGGWVGPRADLDVAMKGKKSHHCPSRELNPGPPSRSLVSVLTELLQLSLLRHFKKISGYLQTPTA